MATTHSAEHDSLSISNVVSESNSLIAKLVTSSSDSEERDSPGGFSYGQNRNLNADRPSAFCPENPSHSIKPCKGRTIPMIRSLILFAALATLPLNPLISLNAMAGEGCGGAKATDCCQNCCGGCMLVCSPECKTVKEKKHGWEVECEHVCIPKVRCPLFNLFGCGSGSSHGCQECGDKNCQGNCNGSCQQSSCAKIRTVRKLKKEEYETEKTVVEWKVTKCAIGCGKCCDGCAPMSCCGPGM